MQGLPGEDGDQAPVGNPGPQGYPGSKGPPGQPGERVSNAINMTFIIIFLSL